MLPTQTSKFLSMTEQPPTPPRDVSKAVEDAITFLDDGNEVDRLTKRTVTNTTTIRKLSDASVAPTPSSSQDTAITAPGSRRVDFSPHPRYHSIAPIGQLNSPGPILLKRSPSGNAKPKKSILKQSHAPPPTPDDLESKLSYFSPTIPGSFSKMLQSALQQLAGPSRSGRTDSYQALNGALRAYADSPDISAMQMKMGPLMQFLSRDIAWKDLDGKLDVPMIHQALTLTYAILARPSLSQALDDDFRTFMVDRSILVLEQAGTPKQTVKEHAHLMGQQNFKSSIMTPGKAEKLVSALRTIGDRCSGNRVATSRLMVYSRLVEQAPGVMLNRMPDWLDHVFHGMLSSVDYTRQQAIETCTRAGLSLGTQAQAAKALEDLLRDDGEGEENYMLWLSIRLTDMVSSKENAQYVPQIWAAVILFYRSKRKPLDKWPKFKACWLSVIQKCFNSSDTSVRQQAAVAWNKLVFATMPDALTTKTFMSMLQIPISSALGKRGNDKTSKDIKGYTWTCYYNLLHYSLRPGLSLPEYDTAWDLLVQPVLSPMVKVGSKERSEVCRILHGLFSVNSGVWNANAAFDAEPINPEQLPRLEPRWVRSRLSKVLLLLEPILEAAVRKAEWSHAQVDSVWRLLMQCIAHAGAQEVKTTSELKEAIALLVSMYRRIWQRCAVSSEAANLQSWLGQYTSLVAIMPEQLGSTPFVEEILARTDTNSIEVAPTPSQRPSKHHSAPVSPMAILLGQFYHIPGASEATVNQACAQELVHRFLSSTPTALAKLELLSRSLQVWSYDYQAHSEASVITAMWIVVADNATAALQRDAEVSCGQESQSLGVGLRSGLDIITHGLCVDATPALFQSLGDLHDELRNAARRGAGEGGVVLAVMEPLAKAMLDGDERATTEKKIWLATKMLQNPVWPKTRQTMEQARKVLWGLAIPSQKTSLFDPFDKTYDLISKVMATTYDNFDGNAESVLAASDDFVTSIVDFLRKAPTSLLPIALRKVQNGLAIWVEDKAKKTSRVDTIATQVRTTWSSVISLLRSLPSKDSNVLQALEPLLVAGFASPHRSIVNESILFWNDTFGSEATLVYPPILESVLRARAADAEIELPSFPDSSEERVPASLPDFFESQSQSERTSTRLQVFDSPSKSNSPAQQSPQRLFQRSPFFSKSPGLRRPISTSSPLRKSGRSVGSSTPKARLRHNDSQIQFAPIDSSPLQPTDESQGLTEHQKEVKARQLLDAQLFPEMSSSPFAQSTALQGNVAKQLNFTSRADLMDVDATGTPNGLLQGNVLPSDDMPSSPTPSSTRAVSQGPLEVEDDSEDDRLAQDPPSSPPQAANNQDQHDISQDSEEAEEDPDDTTITVTDFAEIPIAATTAETVADDAEPATEDMVSASEYPSDSQLPTAQLQTEAEDAAQRDMINIAKSPTRNVVDREGPRTRSSLINPTATAPAELFQAAEPETHDVDVSRIENSFLEADDNDETGSQATEASQSQSVQKSGRKRKRLSGVVYTAKKQKRKQQSPLKRIWSSFVGGTQQDDNDDMEDEIVVATSQRSLSPPASRIDPVAASQEEPAEKTSQPIGDPVKGEPGTMLPPPKRGRGRPRKSQSKTPTPSLPDAEATRPLKRRASTISNASVESSQVSTSFVENTPAPAKAAKLRDGQDTRHSQSSQSDHASQESGLTTRKVKAVVVNRSESQAMRERSGRQSQADDSQPNGSEEDGSQAAARSQDRPVLTPRSILGRLRNALSDFTGMIMGSQEEREFDDVLFELRRETHEAARRGRET